MKLAILGLITAGIGLAIGAEGLVGIGAFWVLIGPVMRMHGQRLQELTEQRKQAEATSGTVLAGAASDPAVDPRTFAIGTVLWLALGVPSLLVGLLELGIDPQDAGWRWLPIAVGALALGIGVIGGVLYLTGSAATAYADRAPRATIPATLWIRSVQETGTMINERPRIEFGFHVEPDDGSGVTAYDVVKKATVPFTAMAGLRVGDGFKAMVVGPEDPTVMDIRWDEPVPAAGGGPDDLSERLEVLERLRAEQKISEPEYQAQRARILDSL